MKNVTSLNDIRQLLSNLPGPDEQAGELAREREPQLTKPYGSLGRLEQVSEWLTLWQGSHPPKMEMPRARVFAGNHGVVAKGVSAFPAEVTQQMVYNFEAGGAAINQLCKAFGTELKVEALDLDQPTEDFTVSEAMSAADCIAAMKTGAASVPENTDVLCLGEMGIGNTTSAAAICHALFGDTAELWTGAGTGVEGEALQTKIGVVSAGVTKHKPNMKDGLDALMCLGGRELAAIAGAVITARQNRIPVLLDGYISTAAAATLEATVKGSLDHCMVSHMSMEPGHKKLIDALGQRPLLEMDMRLGEASGAALAVGILKGAVACHTGMVTFADAGVSDKD
jgi:nicotinate-nucleotide--dimethylbenzimidazole phosphoribosyltransferase